MVELVNFVGTDLTVLEAVDVKAEMGEDSGQFWKEFLKLILGKKEKESR